LPKLKFDRDKIFQVLMNLMANALKYSECGRVVIRTQRENEEVHVSVRDSGPGIKAEHLEAIFEPFSQMGDSRKGGTGLGLGIAREIVLAHHGKIWAESELG
ncbi:MAG: sensor histidine kinase, partial [Candidatus Omnitrophota bacterium]